MADLAHWLAERALAVHYGRLSPATRHEAKRRVLDSLGCALGAWDSRPARIARAAAAEVAVPGGASLLGTRHRTTPELAAFSNGTLVRYLDYNDTYLSREPAHPSDNIPAALAVGQAAGASGAEIVAAIVLGYEVQCRLCDAASLRAHGWDHVYYGALSSAVSASRLWGLSAAQTVHALGIAGVCNFATRQTRTGQLSDWKACALANAARNGIFAADLARRGLTGPQGIFEGPRGLFRMVTGPFELGWAAGPDDWMIRRTHIKFWPAEYHAQSAIDAALQLRPEVGDPGAVERIRVESCEAAVSIIGSEPDKWRPTSRETADHSLPYCVAVALLDGDVGPAAFADARLRDPAVLALVDRVEVVQTQECDALYPEGVPNRLVVRLRGGRELVRLVRYPRGHARNPLSDAEVEAKFRRQAAGVVDAATADRIVALAWRLDELADVRPLLEFAAGPAAAAGGEGYH